MPWLVLDTSSPTAVVAVVVAAADDEEVVLAAVALAETRRHAEALSAAVDAVLERAGVAVAALTGVGVGTGPGSFIGVRTGLAFAKGLGRAIDRPVVGVPSLLSLALSDDEDGALPPGRGLVVVDARRGERYVAAVTVGVQGLTIDDAARAVGDGQFVALDAEFVVGGTAGLVLGPGVVVRERTGPSALGMARALRRLDRSDARATLVPRYVRSPDAKLPAVDPARHRARAIGPEGSA